MAITTKPAPPMTVIAKVTSKGQLTIPVEVRRALGVKTGDNLRIEVDNGGFRAVRDVQENVFEKWRGAGIQGIPPGLAGVKAYMQELRGYDEHDDNLD
jgi:antitoxin PrlF